MFSTYLLYDWYSCTQLAASASAAAFSSYSRDRLRIINVSNQKMSIFLEYDASNKLYSISAASIVVDCKNDFSH